MRTEFAWLKINYDIRLLFARDVTSGFIIVEEMRDKLKKDCASFCFFGRKFTKTDI
jgi:hypothetical protein